MYSVCFRRRVFEGALIIQPHILQQLLTVIPIMLSTYTNIFPPYQSLTHSFKLSTFQIFSSLSQKERGGASRDIIGKYERGENSPSVEMAIKLADTLEVSVDYLLGKERFGKYDKEAVQRLQDIQDLDPNTRQTLFSIIDTFVRDARARTAYAS